MDSRERDRYWALHAMRSAHVPRPRAQASWYGFWVRLAGLAVLGVLLGVAMVTTYGKGS